MARDRIFVSEFSPEGNPRHEEYCCILRQFLHTSASSRVAVGFGRGYFIQDFRHEANAGSGTFHVMTKYPTTNLSVGTIPPPGSPNGG